MTLEELEEIVKEYREQHRGRRMGPCPRQDCTGAVKEVSLQSTYIPALDTTVRAVQFRCTVCGLDWARKAPRKLKVKWCSSLRENENK